MSLPKVASREQWLAARKALLVKENELIRARDALDAERRRLPMVEVSRAGWSSRSRTWASTDAGLIDVRPLRGCGERHPGGCLGWGGGVSS